MPTAREEILTALKASGWTLPEDQTTPTLIAGWKRLRVIVKFDDRGGIRGAAIKRYRPFGQGAETRALTTDRRRQVLAFIRGEKNA